MIDVHAHLGVPAAARLAKAAPGFVEPQHADPLTAAYQSVIGPEWERKLVDLPARLAFMDSRGIDVQLLSVNPGQYYYWADAETAADLVEVVNEEIAAEVARAPGRLLGLGTVALQHPALAAEQLRRAVAHRGAVGVQISTQAGGRDLDAPEFEPLWAAAEEADALVFVHPMGSPQLAGRLASSYLSNVVGQPLETTIALSRLIFSGVLDRHPGLRLCAAHGGGYLPHYLGRGERAYAVRPDSRTMRRAPAEYPKSMWFDSVVHSPGVLGRLIEAVGAERVVIGTDYPFDMGEDDPAALLAGVTLTPGRQRAIRDRNAVRLLGRHASRLGAGRRPR